MLPLPSVATQVMTVSPMVKLVSDCGLQKMSETFPELSEAVGVLHENMAVGLSSSASIDWSPEHVMCGTSTSANTKNVAGYRPLQALTLKETKVTYK